jgi:phenylalanyl-tRNA synthetase beta chain
MLFSYNWLQSFFKRKLPKPEKLAELLTMHSFEVKEVFKIKNDWALDIDVLPNRPDCFSHLGIAREISAILNYELKRMDTEMIEDKKLKAKDFIEVKVEDKNTCPRYSARVILDVKIGPSPEWVVERLEACGLRSINNVVDITNYVMLETGQPFHAFDLDKISKRKIIIRRAKNGEKILTLDEKEYELNENVLLIADPLGPLAIAGIKGGKKAEIDQKTKNIVLESANFEPRTIRRGSSELNLKTDASLRFEHGLDPNLTEFGINRAAALIREIAGGKILKGMVDFYPEKVLPKRIKLDFNYVENLLGVKIPKNKIKNILKRLKFELTPIGSSSILVKTPTLRQDIKIVEDLIEEIGRIYGYQKIPSHFPLVSLIPPKKNFEIFWENMVKDILKEAGFSEVYNYSFISENLAKKLDYKKEELIEVENPTSLEFKYLRPSLIPKLLENVQKNQPYFQEIKIFELGKIFNPLQKFGGGEKKMLTGLITGDSFFELKGILDTLFQKLGISEFFYDEFEATPEESKISIWHPKKIAEIKLDGQEIGFLGQISRRVLKKFEIAKNLTIFDIDFEKLQKYCTEETVYQPISKYPATIRDISVLVPRNVLVEEVLNKIEMVSPLIKDIDLFDIYEGEEIPEGKKNLSFHIIFQAKDHQISPKEIDQIQSKITQVLEENPEWEVRKKYE